MSAPALEQLMSRPHVDALLALLVSLDPRLRPSDEHTAELRASAWTTLLGEVDPAFAVKFVELAYQEVRDVAVSPAEILTAWRTQVREAAEQHGEALFSDQHLRVSSSGWSPQLVDYCLEVMRTVRNGGDALSVPRPKLAVQPLTPQQEAWQRRCVFHRICACDHTRCRDGWLDEEETTRGFFGDYPAVVRCPHCNDALLMAIERGIAKKPTNRPRRRAS